AGILGTNTNVNLSTTIVENCFNTGEITINGKSGYTYLNIAGDIIARAGNKEGSVATSKATLSNNLALHGNLKLTTAVQYVSDYASTSIVYPTEANDAQSYFALTSLTDTNGNAIWVAGDGKYPVPAQFASLAKDVITTNYILIETIEELAKIGVDDAYPSNGYYKLANNIDASGVEWTPITTFTGLLDGNGYTISGLNIGKDAAYARAYTAYGLIGTLSGDVRNLKLTDIYYNTYTATATSTYSYIGGIAAIVKQGRINNCYIDGEIIDTTTKHIRVGGIAGHASGTWEIKNCFSNVDITAGYSTSVTGGTLSAAGIMGKVESAGTLSDGISIGEVDARYPGYVGAIASHYYGLYLPVDIENCYSNADIDYYATANMKAFNSHDDNYTCVSEYEMLCGALAGKLPDSEWTDDATDLIPYLNVFEVPTVSTQTEEDAATAVEEAIRLSVLTNYSTEADIVKVAEGCLEKGSLAFTITNFVLTPAIVGTEGNLELSFTVGEATRSITLSIAAIPEFDYTFSTKYVGRADGTITITDANYIGKNYRLYWGDENGALAGYDALATLNDFTVDETNGILTYNTISKSLIPETATKLYLAVDGNLITEFSIDSWRILSGGELKYISAHVSDTHVSYNRSEEALVKTYEKMEELGGKFITVAGDATDRGNDSDFKTLSEIAARYSDTSLWITLGNHDIVLANRAAGLSAQQSLSYVKKYMNGFANPDHTLGSEYAVTVPTAEEEDVLYTDYTWAGGSNSPVAVDVPEGYTLQTDYTMTYDEDMYVFMSVGKARNSSKSTNVDVALTEKQLTWLDKVLNNYYNVEKKNGQTYFIFHYATIENGLGGVSEDEPGTYDNYTESSAQLYAILDKYPVIHISGHTHIPFRSDRNIHIGENHTAIQTPSITKGHQAYEGYIIEHYEGYTLLKGYNFLTEEYIPNAMFYIAEEYQCNPAVMSTLAKTNINATNGTSLTYTKANVYDNRLISYDEQVFKITAPAGNNYYGAYAFTNKVFEMREDTYNDLYDWRINGGDMRFYIKNDGDESLTFQPYLYSKTTLASGTATYIQGIATKAITLQANSGWVEIRLKYSDFTSKGNWGNLGKGTTNTFRIGLYTTQADGFLKNTGGTVYVSNIEFHDHQILSEIETDFDRPYTINTFASSQNYDWKTDSTGNITRSFGACTELPFITHATTLTASDTYAFSNLGTTSASRQIGITYKSGNPTQTVDMWAKNPDAQLRFWIKTTQDTTFGITLQVGSGTAYNSSITVKGSADWQPVVLKSSSFTNVNNIYTYASNDSTRDTYFVMDVKQGTFTAGQQIVIGNRLEFFSHKAYDKGDANKDGSVNIMDLVKADNQMQNGASEFIPTDIDNNGKLNSTDISYIRKWLFDRKWN
ncbi:MAG: metallophosphoesterase, partial [Clostridia bacterium]|nr:metallophosphoesterase [Clostridia bacterium]